MVTPVETTYTNINSKRVDMDQLLLLHQLEQRLTWPHMASSVYGKGIAEGKQQTGKRMEPRIAKLLVSRKAVLDEILVSMINLETLYEISERQKQAMLVYVDDLNDRESIKISSE